MNKVAPSLLLSLLAWFPDLAFSATDGTLGATSQGTANISVSVQPVIQITGIGDIAGTWTGAGDQIGDDDVCIYTNSPSGAYRVTATGSGPGGAFQLSNGSGGNLNFAVRWNDSIGTAGNVEVAPGSALSGQGGACTSSSTCLGCGNNTANFQVVIPGAQLSASPSGTYSGVLFLLVEPD